MGTRSSNVVTVSAALLTVLAGCGNDSPGRTPDAGPHADGGGAGGSIDSGQGDSSGSGGGKAGSGGKAGTGGSSGGGGASPYPSIRIKGSAVATETVDGDPWPAHLFGFEIPASGKVSFAGLRGTVSQTDTIANFNEALISMGPLNDFAPFGGKCPSGRFALPSKGWWGYFIAKNVIIKNPLEGKTTITLDFTLPKTLDLSSNCFIVNVGGSGKPDDPVTYELDLELMYALGPATGNSMGAGGEPVWGLTAGTPKTFDGSTSFATLNQFDRSGRMRMLYGDVSESTLWTDPAAFTSAWSAPLNVYLYRGAACSSTKAAIDKSGGWGNFYASIPGDAVNLFSLSATGVGAGVVQKGVSLPFDIPVTANDCIVTLYGLSLPGADFFDPESQLDVLYE